MISKGKYACNSTMRATITSPKMFMSKLVFFLLVAIISNTVSLAAEDKYLIVKLPDSIVPDKILGR